MIVFILVQNIVGKLLELAGAGKNLRNLIKGILASVVIISTYRLFFLWTEQWAVTEIFSTSLVWNLGLGTLIGVSIQCPTAIFEEILIRGIIFRITEEKLGSYIALFISAAIFGALHLFNPHATLI